MSMEIFAPAGTVHSLGENWNSDVVTVREVLASLRPCKPVSQSYS